MTDRELSQNAQANPGYAQFQVARALVTAAEHADAKTRERAAAKIARWTQVLSGMSDGSLAVGSRAPVQDVPPWVTLEVVTGGFATGELAAAGPLQEHETRWLAELGLRVASGQERRALNSYFLSDAGLARLQEMLRTSCYEVHVPEEAALLTVARLLELGHREEAQDLVATIGPFLDRLRFYPIPSCTPQREGSRVCLRTVADTKEVLEQIEPQERLLAQREAVLVWRPRYDELVKLFLETVEGAAPTLLPDQPRQIAQGGWPCQKISFGWQFEVRRWLADFDQTCQNHRLTTKHLRKKEHFAQLVAFARQCVEDPRKLSGGDVARLRLILACYVTKYGAPDSDLLIWREEQKKEVSGPLHTELAAVVVSRLGALPQKEGLSTPEEVTQPITASEAIRASLPAETLIPPSICRKVEFSRYDTVAALVERRIIRSAETIARVLPQITAALRAGGLADACLRGLYAATYRAFRARRSLLLLNLASQVKLEELPWIAAIEVFRSRTLSTQQTNRQALEEVATLTLTSFPQTIVPNKLLQELRALVKGAELDLPLVDELAADIFMGQFAGKFVQATQQAAKLLEGTLYARYYDLRAEQVPQLKTTKIAYNHWSRPPEPDDLALLCAERAGVPLGTWRPATNGMIIEQQQIVTTQNLAALVGGLQLADALQPQLCGLAERSFRWLVRRLQVPAPKFHARLITLKNCAYAWRQMIFFLSLARQNEVAATIAGCEEVLGAQPEAFQQRFAPAMLGLRLAAGGQTLDAATLQTSGARRFLGWANERHWLA